MAIDVVLVGAGQRGRFVYGAYAERHPDQLNIVGVVEPLDSRRDAFGDAHALPPGRRYRSHESVDIGADAWIIASGDRHHLAPGLAALAAGAHVLVEKPIAASYPDSVALVEAAEAADRQLHVAHVLRYTPFYSTLHDVIRSGRLGDVVTVEHRENVAHWHMAHSFVRGNWARAGTATPMIVQKCCHDFDILEWNATSPVTRLHSFGSLLHFTPDNAPSGAPDRCTDGCPASETCPYEAQKIYMNERWTGWPVHVITDDLSPEGRMRALRDGPYGRCVYTAGSDVVDQQVVVMERADGSTWTLVMHGHSADETRSMRYDGTRATLRAVAGRSPEIQVQDHRSGAVESVPIPPAVGGHGGGDPGLVASFTTSVADGMPSRTTGRTVLESHLLAFAAEESRVTGSTIHVSERRR